MVAGVLPYLTERYPLLVTKLYIPRLDTELLPRPHLMERLNRAATQPLVVIAAPAGWGKTTLVDGWVRQAGRPIGWVSLDEGDNDLSRFWLHLIAAMQQIRPGVGETALSWFYARAAPPVEARLEMLINDLALMKETFIPPRPLTFPWHAWLKRVAMFARLRLSLPRPCGWQRQLACPSTPGR